MPAPVAPPHLPQGQESPDIVGIAPRTQDYPRGDEYGAIPQTGPALTGLPTTGVVSIAERQMPGPGFIPGTLNLNPALAPTVPEGSPRPFAPGEWLQNPNGSWSSEITMTAQRPDGSWVNVPSLWIKDGKAYVAKSEDEALALAKQSGLEFPAFNTLGGADAASRLREKNWQGLKPHQAQKVPPLWKVAPKPQPKVPDWVVNQRTGDANTR